METQVTHEDILPLMELDQSLGASGHSLAPEFLLHMSAFHFECLP